MGTPAWQALIDAYREREDASARRLLVTVFGDSIEPRGGCIWLGDLIALVEPVGIGERLVRTSVGRLVADGLLQNRRVGRRSRYEVTGAARRDFRAAERRIYHPARVGWDGHWTVVVATGERPSEERAALRMRLGWQGFAEVAPAVLVRPSAPDAEVRELVGPDVVVLRADGGADDDRALLAASHELEPLTAAYAELAARYRPVLTAATAATVPEPEAFLVRTLLVDDYRRLLLRDPGLPTPLLPEPWPGDEAARVVAALYRAVDAAAERHLTATCTGPGGEPLPERDPALPERFPIAPAAPAADDGATNAPVRVLCPADHTS